MDSLSSTNLAPVKAQSKSHGFIASLFLALIVFGICFALTYVSWKYSKDNVKARADLRFNSVAEDIKEILSSRIREYLSVLSGTEGLFAASDNVSRVEFARYLDAVDLNTNYKGYTAVLFLQSVKGGEEKAFEESIKNDTSASPSGYPNFQMKPIGHVSAQYFVLNYVYPTPASPSANFGLDFGTDPTRLAAITAAKDEDKIVMTAPTKLLGTQTAGFIAYKPVYLGGSKHDTVEERNTLFKGVLSGVFNAQNFFNNVYSDHSSYKDIQFRLTDVTDPAQDVFIYGLNEDVLQNKTAKQDMKKDFLLNVGGRTWKIDVTSDSSVFIGEEANLPKVIFVAGTLISFSLAATFFFVLISRNLAVNLASRMTKNLTLSQIQLSEAKSLDEAILLGIGDAVFAIDLRGNIVLFNRVAERISGFSLAEAIGQPYTAVLRFLHEKTGSFDYSFIDRAMAGEATAMSNHTSLIRKDDSKVPVADSAAPIMSKDGVIRGVVVVFRDVTKERQLELLKDEFVSLASHELRTPMTAIRGFISMIMDGDFGVVPETLSEPLKDIGASTDRLIHLVNDMLNVSRIEAGRLKFELAEVQIVDVIKEVVATLQPIAIQKNLVLSGQPDGVKVSTVQADPDKVKQILNNLLGNSLKFTEHGQITVTAQERDQLIEVLVTDTGMGISADNQQKLFGKFQQISSNLDGKPSGTGLGLYLSRQLAERMGGALWIMSSEEGKGSTFVFSIPISGTTKADAIKKEIEAEAQFHPDQK